MSTEILNDEAAQADREETEAMKALGHVDRKVYFKDTPGSNGLRLIAVGTSEGEESYTGDYSSSEVFCLPTPFWVKGLSWLQLKDAQNEARRKRIEWRHRQSLSPDELAQYLHERQRYALRCAVGHIWEAWEELHRIDADAAASNLGVMLADIDELVSCNAGTINKISDETYDNLLAKWNVDKENLSL